MLNYIQLTLTALEIQRREIWLNVIIVWQGIIDHELKTEKWNQVGKEYFRYWHEHGVLRQGQNNTYEVKVKNLVCPLGCNLSHILWYKFYKAIYIYGNTQIFFTQVRTLQNRLATKTDQ